MNFYPYYDWQICFLIIKRITLTSGRKRSKIKMLFFDAWLSLVERGVRDAEGAGSNPVASRGYLRC